MDDLTVAAEILAQATGALLARHGGGGEGPDHLALKHAVRDDPYLHLGEQLLLVREEYPFPTHDEADLLFGDADGRLLIVEIKVDVTGANPAREPAILQLIKYRAMLATMLGRSELEIRCALAARSIAPEIVAAAEDFGIEMHEITGVL